MAISTRARRSSFATLVSELTDGLTRDLTVDLTDVDLLPSSAVGVIANAQDTARQQGATLAPRRR